MATKKTRRKSPPRKTLPVSLAALKEDLANPRKIHEAAVKALGTSLDEFGDISGITFNLRTGELVTGHQRIKEIRRRWGDLKIESLDGVKDRAIVRSPEGHTFPIRLVDWSKARQRAANVAANSHLISGEFTEDLEIYLSDVADDLKIESAGLMEDLLLTDLYQTKTTGQQTSTTLPTMLFQVIVEAENEDHQVELLDRFAKEGLKCRALIS